MTTGNGTSGAARTRSSTKSSSKGVVNRVKSEEAVDVISEKKQKARREKVIKNVAEKSIEKATKDIANLSLNLNKELTNLGSVFTTKLAEIKELDEAIEFKTKELSEFHDKELVLAAIKDLTAEYEQQEQVLKTTIEAERAQWAEERKAHKRAVDEEYARIQMERKRDEEEYEYETARRRKMAEADWQDQQNEKTRQFEEAMNSRVDEINTREKLLQEREAKMDELTAKVNSFDDTVKAETAKQVAIVSNSMKKDYTHQLEMKDFEIRALNERLERLNDEINTNKQLLANANVEVTRLAQSALDAASGKQALSALQSAQAQNNTNKK